MENVLRIITEVSLKNNIAVQSFAPGGEKPQNYYVEIPISLNIAGQFNAVGKFLSILGQQERILTAKNLQLSYSPNPQKGQTVMGTFTLFAFVFKG
jgi:type IV pilus assembly protein PilO